MGFFLIILLAGILLFGAGIILLEKIEGMPGSHEGLSTTGICSAVVGVILLWVGVLFFFFTGIDKLYSKVNLEKLANERGKYIRLLNENYNADNLSTALNFNERQKLCKFKESGFMWSHFNTDGVCVDTIDIPTGKFMPSQKITITADSTGK